MKICEKCFNDPSLTLYIRQNGVDGICDVTNEKTKVIDTVDLSDSFDSFISSFVESTKGIPFYSKIQQDWNIFNEQYGRIIFDALLKERKSALTLDTSVDYSDKIKHAVQDWNILKDNLINKYRYLSIRDWKNETYYNEAFAVHASTINRDTILYRSRVNDKNSEIPFKKDEMSAPPQKVATAGRANPQGIAFLYLSNNVETTFYEIRAVYLDNVSTGVFKALDDIKIVDFTKHGSPFDTIYSESGVQSGIISEFIAKEISDDLSRPMRRHDSVVDYVPTQFICEYIKYVADAKGIAFGSSLYDSGVNYVIFDPSNFECQDDVQIHRINKVIIEE